MYTLRSDDTAYLAGETSGKLMWYKGKARRTLARHRVRELPFRWASSPPTVRQLC